MNLKMGGVHERKAKGSADFKSQGFGSRNQKKKKHPFKRYELLSKAQLKKSPSNRQSFSSE